MRPLVLGLLLVVATCGEAYTVSNPATGAGPSPADDPCPAASGVRVIERAAQPLRPTPVPVPSPNDYRDRLKPTPAGWARRDHWCVWVEPVGGTEAELVWQGRWQQAVDAALGTWARQLPITRVEDPERAQVRLYRRRPPLREEGRSRRASHGRAVLLLVDLQRQGQRRLEPRVEVLISPDQRQLGIQATALHELGHAFGLWGHSDQSGDAMAAVPGAAPVLELSPRDLATLRWLQQQPALGAAAPDAQGL